MSSIAPEGLRLLPRTKIVAGVACLLLTAGACSDDNTDTPSTALTATCVASPNSGAVPLRVSFLVRITGEDPSYALDIQYGDGSSGSSGDAPHTYTRTGAFQMVASVRSGDKTASCQQAITVNAAPTVQNKPPNAVFKTNPSPPQGPAPLTVEFNMCPTADPENGKLEFLYTMGDGSAQTDGLCRKGHTYRTPGTYKATVCVSDGDDRNQICQAYTVKVT